MLHPSYTDLMKVINSEVETGEAPVVNSRYSIVLASAKRARQLIAGADPLIGIRCPKPLSIAVDELYNSKIRILSEEEAAEAEAKKLAEEIDKMSVTVSIKAGEGGRAFGSVSTKEIAKAAKDQLKLDIDKKKMVLPEPIKSIGSFEVPIKLHKEVTARLSVKVVEA